MNCISEVYHKFDHYPGGMLMPGRYSMSDYLYGFNGQEKVDEISGVGNSLNFGSRMLDPRIGRWLSTDRYEIKFPGVSPYCAFLNSPNVIIDPDGNRVKATSVEARRIILLTLDPKDAKRIKFDRFGFIKEKSVLSALRKSASENLEALAQAVKAKEVINVSLTKEGTFAQDSKGKLTYIQMKDFDKPSFALPEDNDELKKEIQANNKKPEGVTLIPLKLFTGTEYEDLNYYSDNEEINVVVSTKGANEELVVRTLAHELMAHVYQFLTGKDPGHRKGEKNKELEDKIESVTQEAETNYAKKRKK